MHHSNTEETAAAEVVGFGVGKVKQNLGLGMVVMVVDTPCSAGAQKISSVALAEQVEEEKEANLGFQIGVGMALDSEGLQNQKQKGRLF